MKMVKKILRPFAAEAPLQVILFIGHHKVGSTSLQDFLARNAAVLAQQGILYPFTDFEGMAHMAAAAGRRRPPRGALPVNVREPHNALAFRMLASRRKWALPGYHKLLPGLVQMQHAIQQQIRFSRPHTVILAAEVFANFGTFGTALVEELAGGFPGAEFTVVATLRRIDDYLASWHGQRLKFGHRVKALRRGGGEDYIPGIHFDYRRMLEAWLQALPDAQLILRDYAEVQAGGGSVADFFAQTGLVLPKGVAPERRENDSLHRAAYEIALKGNRRLPPEQAEQLRQALRKQAPRLKLPPSSSVELFGAARRARLAERFAPVDAWLGAQAGRPGFFAGLEDMLTERPVPEAVACGQLLAQLETRPDWCGGDADLQAIAALCAEWAANAAQKAGAG